MVSISLCNRIYNVLQLTEDIQTTLLQAEQWEPKSSGCGSGLNGSRAMKASSSSLNWQQQQHCTSNPTQYYPRLYLHQRSAERACASKSMKWCRKIATLTNEGPLLLNLSSSRSALGHISTAQARVL